MPKNTRTNWKLKYESLLAKTLVNKLRSGNDDFITLKFQIQIYGKERNVDNLLKIIVPSLKKDLNKVLNK